MHEVNIENTSDFRSYIHVLRNYILTVLIIYSLCVLKRYKQTKTNITQKLASSAFCKYLYLTVITRFRVPYLPCWSVSRFSGSVFILLLSVPTMRSGEGYSDYIEKKTNVFIALLKHPLKTNLTSV